MITNLIIIVIVIILAAISILYFFQEKMIFFPEKIDPSYKYSFNVPFEEIFIKSDESEINALHFKLANPKGVILYFHGNSGSLDTWGLLGEEFTATGYDFLIFDYRGYGKSKGKLYEEGFHKDSRMLYDYLLKTYKEEDIVLYGRSIGSGFATKLASEKNPKILILETPYYSFETVAKHHFPFLPVGMILKWSMRTDLWISRVKSPILIFHGTKDEVIPYEQSILLEKLLKPGDKFVTVLHGEHGNIPTYPEYSLYMKKYLEIP